MKVFAIVVTAVAIVLLAVIVKASWETGHQVGFKAGETEAEYNYTFQLQLQAQEYEAKLADQKATTESVKEALRLSLSREHEASLENEALALELGYTRTEIDIMARTGGKKPFRTWSEFYNWLEANPVSEREYIPEVYVCTDFVYDTIFDAEADGYFMGASRISNEQHQNAFTLIGRHIVEFNPQNDGIVSTEGTVYRSYK